MAKDAYYFPHDSNAQHDEKILQLRSKHGWEGYGLYWAIIEKLRDSTNYRFSLNAIAGLSISLSHPQAKLQAMLEDCYTIGLLEKNGDYFHSGSLTRRMLEIDTRRESLREFGRRGGIASSQAKAKLEPPSSSKVKNSKVKESINSDPPKTTYLTCVLLTAEQHSKLVTRFGEEKTRELIFRLNNYIESKGKHKTYKSHYHTILNWETRNDRPAS